VLSRGPHGANWAADAAFLPGDGGGAWVVVGGTPGPNGRDGAAWRSSDGQRWSVMPVPAAPDYDEMTVVAPVGEALVALGPGQDAFQAWRLEPGGWVLAGRFGDRSRQPATGPMTAAVPVDIAAAGDTLLALVKVANEHQLWRSLDAGETWQPVAAPAGALPAAGGQTATLVPVPDGIMLVTDDLARARVWVSALAG
jgi:hypothetical protein